MNIGKFMDRKISLITPVSEDSVRQLQVDDEVFLTSRLFVMLYSWHFTKAIAMARAGRTPPMSLQNGAIIHSPTSYIEKDNDYQIRFIGVTISSKLNQWSPDIIEFFRIRCIIGKEVYTELVSCYEKIRLCLLSNARRMLPDIHGNCSSVGSGVLARV